MSDPNAVEWRRCQSDGDPVWYAELGGLKLAVIVACEWVWEWTVDSDESDDLARGSVFASTDEEVSDDDWDYQNVEWAQRRCEAVARALLADSQKSGES